MLSLRSREICSLQRRCEIRDSIWAAPDSGEWVAILDVEMIKSIIDGDGVVERARIMGGAFRKR